MWSNCMQVGEGVGWVKVRGVQARRSVAAGWLQPRSLQRKGRGLGAARASAAAGAGEGAPPLEGRETGPRRNSRCGFPSSAR